MIRKKYLLITILFCTFTCGVSAASKEPAWVTDYASVYPESQWVCVVESAKDKTSATASAQNSLAKTFKLDVTALSSTMQTITQNVGDKSVSYSKKNAAKEQVSASTNVSGLMGVSSDSWKAKDGTVYVILRMNRKDGAALYSSIINENNSIINDYINSAKSGAATFESYAELNYAANLALINDNYLNILSILDPAARKELNISYRNAAAIRKLADESGRAIVIAIKIKGDDSGRVKKAFTQVFTKCGFKTTDTTSQKSYTLRCDFTISEVSFNGNPNKFARYELQSVLLDFQENEILSYSSSNREGHLKYSEAILRALRSAEKSIIDDENEDSFSTTFSTYLLKHGARDMAKKVKRE
jgi:hypothetical protein